MVRNEPGALFKLLSCFALRNINITRIEMRSLGPNHAWLLSHQRGRKRRHDAEANEQTSETENDMFVSTGSRWEYLTFIDFEPSIDGVVTDQAMENLRQFALKVVELGVYEQNLAKAEFQANNLGAQLGHMV
eukprot:c18363_g1_i2.p1 GENE.c18363_g1_i2~~c18363_g1_i2.p1  ORF type:complete len:132 (+),score=32.06 c18363_g1_i2:763-1158(+)